MVSHYQDAELYEWQEPTELYEWQESTEEIKSYSLVDTSIILVACKDGGIVFNIDHLLSLSLSLSNDLAIYLSLSDLFFFYVPTLILIDKCVLARGNTHR